MSRNSRRPIMSMRGVLVDMEALQSANEQSRAVGNGNMNARGDLLGPTGQIEIRREQLAKQFHEQNLFNSQQVSLKPAEVDDFQTPEEAMARLVGQVSQNPDVPESISPRRNRKLVDNNDD